MKLSLLGNAVLAVLCAILWLTSPGKDGKVQERAAAERFRAKLGAEFPQTARIHDFGKEASGLPKYDAIANDPKYAAAAMFLEHAQAYIDFVNHHILDNTQPKDLHP